VYVELTSRCNFNCITCARDFANLDYPDMDFETFKIVESNFSDSIEIINFTGFGEASLNKDFSKILRYAKSKGFFLEHTSNVSIFNLENLEVLDQIIFSLDGVKNVKNIRIGISDKVIEKIKEACKYKNKNNLNVKIGINMVLRYDNFNEIEDMFKFCEDIGVDFLNLATFVNSPTLYETKLYDMFNDIIKKNQKVIDYKKIVDLYDEKYNFSLTILYPKPKLKGMCVFPFRDFQVNSKGELILCCRTLANSYVLGDLKKEKMDNILNTKKVKYIKKAHLEDLPFEICDRCNRGWES